MLNKPVNPREIMWASIVVIMYFSFMIYGFALLNFSEYNAKYYIRQELNMENVIRRLDNIENVIRRLDNIENKLNNHTHIYSTGKPRK